VVNHRTYLGIRLFFGFVFLFAFSSLAQAASVTIELSSKKVYVGDEVEVRVQAKGAIDEVDAPFSPGLEFRAGGQSTSITIINGRRESHFNVNFIAIATVPGIYTIHPAKGLSKGRVVAQSQTLEVTVVESPTLDPVSPEEINLESHEGEAVFLMATVPKETVVLGEPTQLRVDLFIREGFNVRNLQDVKPGKMSGFLRRDLLADQNQRKRLQKRVVIGRTAYQAVPLERWMLTPVSVGQFSIGQTKARLSIGRGFQNRSKTVTAQPIRLNVIAPPKASKPHDYVSGQVGTFRLTGRLNRTHSRVGDPVIINVAVAAEGNADAISRPLIRVPDGLRIEAVPGDDCDELEIIASGTKGACRYQYIIYPEEVGTHRIEAVRIAYYDPTVEIYRLTTIGPWQLRVLPSESDKAQPATVTVKPKRRRLTPEPLAGLRGDESPLPDPPAPWLAYGIPVVVLFLLEGLRLLILRRKADPKRAVRGMLSRAKRTIRSAPMDDTDLASKRMASGLRNALVAVLAVDSQGLTRDRLRRSLLERSVEEELVIEILELLEAFEAIRFGNADGTESIRDRTLDVVERLRRQV
tara:strand:- start:1190 stop:2929 length:1740 start_codon:yes stop_codon:yes gene_type:complete